MALYPFSLGQLFSYHVTSSILKVCIRRIAASPMLLAYHFFSVAFYSIYVMFVYPSIPPPSQSLNGQANGNGHSVDVSPVYRRPSLLKYPALLIKGVRVVCLSSVSFAFHDLDFLYVHSSGQRVSSSALYYGQNSAGGRLQTQGNEINSSYQP